jgi:hypothetical protein
LLKNSQRLLKENSIAESKIGEQIGEQRGWRKEKGCDFGYALAAGSCEEAHSVDACTVTALDAITAFAVPNPNCSSQESVGFFGSGRSSGCPSELITQPTSDRQRFIFASPFSHRRVPP